jgi:thiamine biosynthesis lipoprotein
MLVDHSFAALGTTVRVLVDAPDAQERAARAAALIRDYERRLSRFDPSSELCALNADLRDAVPASALLRDAVRVAIQAAHRTGGLVDPTLLGALERAGYVTSRAPGVGGDVRASGCAPVPLPPGPPRPARPHPACRWRALGVDDEGGTVLRPPGVRLDLGGTGKGHVADLVAELLAGARRWAIDAGGDVGVGGTAGPQIVEVAHPFDPAVRAGRFLVASGAVATSAIHARAWVRDDGRPAHHLLDPSTGEPVWSGVVAATALAPTVLEAETLAKAAVLSGPERGRRLLRRRGGLLVDADGRVEHVGTRSAARAPRAAA